jgi:hypothetical protein
MPFDRKMNEDDERWNERQKVDPTGSPRKEISSHFNANQTPGLYPPETPWLLGQIVFDHRHLA